jgi:hypothetical protein
MRDLTGPDRHRSPLDPPRLRTGPHWPESADPFRPCPTAMRTPDQVNAAYRFARTVRSTTR